MINDFLLFAKNSLNTIHVGKFTSLRGLNQREQTKLLGGDVFQLSYDDWMAAPGAKQWSEGQGVFVNNYNNFILWVNLEVGASAQPAEVTCHVSRTSCASCRCPRARTSSTRSSGCRRRWPG